MVYFCIAASIATLIFAGSSLYFFVQNQDLLDENQVIVDELYDLRSDIDENNLKLEALSEEFSRLNNPETEKYILNGNGRAKNLKTIAYINPKEKTSLIDVVSLPIFQKIKSIKFGQSYKISKLIRNIKSFRQTIATNSLYQRCAWLKYYH